MVEIISRVKKWGDSVAVIIPKKIADTEKIKPREMLHLVIRKEQDLSDLFGRFKTKKTAQQLKDEAKSGWE